MNGTNTLSISDLRKNTASVIETIFKKKEQRIILQRSKPKAVLVDIEYFRALEDLLFYITDSNEAERAKKEKGLPFNHYINKRWGKSNPLR